MLFRFGFEGSPQLARTVLAASRPMGVQVELLDPHRLDRDYFADTVAG